MFSFLSRKRTTKTERLKEIHFPIDDLPAEFICPISDDPIEEALSLDGNIVDKNAIKKWWEQQPLLPHDKRQIFNQRHPYTNELCREIKPVPTLDAKFEDFIVQQKKAYTENKEQYEKKIQALLQKIQLLNQQLNEPNKKQSFAEKKSDDALTKEIYQLLLEKDALEKQPPHTFFTGRPKSPAAPIKHTLSLPNIVSRSGELFEDARGGFAALAQSSSSIEHYQNEHFFMGLVSLQALPLPHCFRDAHTNERLIDAYLAYDEEGHVYALNKSTLDNHYNSLTRISYLPKTNTPLIKSEPDALRQQAINDFFNRLKEIANALIDDKAHEADPYLNAIHFMRTQQLLQSHLEKTKEAMSRFTLAAICKKEIKQVTKKEDMLLRTYSYKLDKLPHIQPVHEHIKKMAQILISINQFRGLTKQKDASFKDQSVLQLYLNKFIQQARALHAALPADTPIWPWLAPYEEELQSITQQMKQTLPRPSRSPL